MLVVVVIAVVVVVVVVVEVEGEPAAGTCIVIVFMTVGRGCTKVGEADAGVGVDGPWSADSVL